MPAQAEVLSNTLESAIKAGEKSVIDDEVVAGRIDFICRCYNRAGVRLLMSCLLARLHRPGVDPRKPFTVIGSPDAFSGRTYDERYLSPFINANRLPCNSTTAFLTPALRNHDRPLTTSTRLVGRPREMYEYTIELLEEVAAGRLSAGDALIETLRILLMMRDERQSRIDSLLSSLNRGGGSLPLSSEAIVNLLDQHLKCKHSSRLPVLIVAAAYTAASGKLGERNLPLKGHDAADEQTGALGDVEICLTNDDRIRTIYEMKSKRVTKEDLERALQKISTLQGQVDNYVFITTDVIEQLVAEYATTLYEKTGGTEFVILDCLGFLRHFLHLFHRLRTEFLEAYQALVLGEPTSSVSAPLKEAFLSLRHAAESED